MLHSNVEPGSVDEKVNEGTESFDGSAGFVTMFVFGAVRSTSTFRIAVAVWPALSVATAARAWLPSATGIDQETL